MNRFIRLLRIIRLDLIGTGNILIYISIIEIKRIISSFIAKIGLILKGVKFSNQITFYGLPVIHRYPGSLIQLMEGVVIRSDRTSNLIGITRRTILATHSKTARLKIGTSTGISGAAINSFEMIEIGNNVLIGANCIITDSDWHPEINISKNNTAPIIIEDNVWLGANTIILKGVKIGKNTIIGAGSIVVNDIPENVVAAGNPCKVIKQRLK